MFGHQLVHNVLSGFKSGQEVSGITWHTQLLEKNFVMFDRLHLLGVG